MIESAKQRVLLVEDLEPLRRAYARLLEHEGYLVTQVGDGFEALAALAKEHYSVVLTDVSMPGMTGNVLLSKIREQRIDVPVVLVSGNPSLASALDAIEHGAVRYLVKPVSSEDLLGAIERATKLSQIAALKSESVAFLSSVEHVALSRAEEEAKLRAAIDSLWMAYQPIVDFSDKHVIAFEALVRTNEPTLMKPDALFSLAERLDLVHEVSRAVRSSIAQTLTQSGAPGDFFVNLHPKDLLDEALFSSHDPLAPFAARVVLEVTERQALDQSAGISARAARLRRLGYRIAIDDLGAGYAGLTYFSLLTPDVVKIDISLVHNIDREKVKQKLVGSLASLCKSLGMKVVVEGVETELERQAVTDLGCNVLQGFLFAHPGTPFPQVKWS